MPRKADAVLRSCDLGASWSVFVPLFLPLSSSCLLVSILWPLLSLCCSPSRPPLAAVRSPALSCQGSHTSASCTCHRPRVGSPHLCLSPGRPALGLGCLALARLGDPPLPAWTACDVAVSPAPSPLPRRSACSLGRAGTGTFVWCEERALDSGPGGSEFEPRKPLPSHGSVTLSLSSHVFICFLLTKSRWESS